MFQVWMASTDGGRRPHRPPRGRDRPGRPRRARPDEREDEGVRS